jgi:hypothetical protein
MCVCVRVCVYVCVCLCECVCTCVCVYLCVHLCMCGRYSGSLFRRQDRHTRNETQALGNWQSKKMIKETLACFMNSDSSTVCALMPSSRTSLLTAQSVTSLSSVRTLMTSSCTFYWRLNL